MKNRRNIEAAPDYAVDINGNVWSKRKSWCNPKSKWMRMKPIRTRDNHLQIFLQTPKGCVRFFIHRLVLETFIGQCPEGYETRHKDGNPMNNALSNLCWATHEENMLETWEHGRMSCGSKHPGSKITEKTAEQIIIRSAQGETRASLSREFGISRETVRKIASGLSWRHVIPKT